MPLPPFDELYEAFRRSDETVQIEAKRTEKEFNESVLKTITAFANEPGLGGGYLLLGISRTVVGGNNVYEITGLQNADKIQSDLANQCNGSFNHCIRPDIGVHVTPEGKRVVIAHIPEADPSEKPVHYLKGGTDKGCYRRIGSADVLCKDNDIAMFYRLRDEAAAFDDAVVRGASLSDIDRVAVKEYRTARAEINPLAEELRYNMPELLTALGALQETKSGLGVTRAGLILFGKSAALRKFFPTARVDYLIVAGQHLVAADASGYRSLDIRQPLLLAIPKIVELVMQDLPTTFQLKGRRTRRKEIPAIPHTVVREAIVNAVTHRDYRSRSQIQIRRFSNRLEIANPGYSLVPADRLGTLKSETRNPRIADVLRDSGFAENKGTGIRRMREQMHAMNLTAPFFNSTREDDGFVVTLLTHHLFDADTIAWLSAFAEPYALTDHDSKALILARDTGFINNAGFRNINAVDTLAASKALQRLRDVGLLETHGKGNTTYYTPSERLLTGNTPSDTRVKGVLSGKRSTPLKPAPLQLTPELVALITEIGERTPSRALLETVIVRLCAIRPLRLPEIGRYIRRDPQYLQRVVAPMVKNGALRHLYPDKPAHPKQAYSAAAWMGDIEAPPQRQKAKRARTKQQRLF